MTKTQTKLCVLIVIILSVSTFTLPLVHCQGELSAITQAKNTLASSYQAVAHAESAGANVDSLMTTLNQAADLLSKAQLANAAGNYSAANNYAGQCQSKLSGVAAEASTLQQDALSRKSQEYIFTILTLLVSVAIFVSGVVTWFVLNKRERRSIDGSKPI